MKYIMSLLILSAVFSGCRKNPDMDDMDHDFIVRTSYDESIAFSTFSTYYIPDSILLIGNRRLPDFWTDDNALRIINTLVGEMNNRGYTRVRARSVADLGIQMSYVESTYYYIDYPSDSWWWGYPGYWGPGYWGDWGGWYYPYPVSYAFSTSSLLTDMIDLHSPQGRDQKLDIVWNAYMTGLLSRSDQYNVDRSIRAIGQAFTQSAYIRK